MKCFIGLLVLCLAATPVLAVGSGASRSGASVAFAHIDGADHSVESFGGKGTHAAVSSGTPYALVVFSGHYPPDITPEKVVLQVTCTTSAMGTAHVAFASPTEIRVLAYCSVGDGQTFTYVQQDLFVNVFLGQ